MEIYHPHKHRRLVPILCVAAGIPIALVAMFLLVANLRFHDEAAPNDASLQLRSVHVAASDNAYSDLTRASTDYATSAKEGGQPNGDTILNNMLDGTAWDEAHATALLKTNAAAVADVRAAMEKNSYQDPGYADPAHLDVTRIPDLTGLQELARIIAVDGIIQARHGQVATGLADGIAVTRLGQTIEMGQGTLIEYLVGSSIKQIGLRALRQIGLHVDLSADQVTATARAIEPYRDSRAGLAAAMKVEYAGVKASLGRTKGLGTMIDEYSVTAGTSANPSSTGNFFSALDAIGITRYYYFPNQTLRFAAENARQRVTDALAPCTTTINEQVPAYSHRHGLSKIFESNAVGKYLSDIGISAWDGVYVRSCDEGVSVTATQTILAISAYEKGHQAPPPTLTALVPTYLAAVPLDPFSGEAFKYTPSTQRIYSVGDTHQDHGGSPIQTDLKNMVNPTFRVRP